MKVLLKSCCFLWEKNGNVRLPPVEISFSISSDLTRFQQRSTVRSPYALLKRLSLKFTFIFTSKDQIHLGDNLEHVILHPIDISDASLENN